MTKGKRGMIPPYALLCLFFVSRIVVTLTYVQGVSVGKFSTDILISIALSLCLMFVLSIPAFLCVNRGISPINYPPVAFLYSVYFCFSTALGVSRFASFASSRMNTGLSMIVVIVLVSIAMCYGACLGIESIARYGFVCAILLVLTLVAVLGLNVHNIIRVNFYPLVENTRADIIKNAFLFTSNSIAPAYLLTLSPRVNGKIGRVYFGGITLAYLAIFLLVAFCSGVMGSSASLQSYPIYTLFQLASIGTFSRLDMLHSAFWILSVLLKSSLMIYCASITVRKLNHTTKCIVFSIIAGVIAIIISELVGTDIVTPSKIISIVNFAAFALAFPIFSLVRGKKNEKS